MKHRVKTIRFVLEKLIIGWIYPFPYPWVNNERLLEQSQMSATGRNRISQGKYLSSLVR